MFTTPHWGWVKPFALTEQDAATTVDGQTRPSYDPDNFDGVYFDPGLPPQWGKDSPTLKQCAQHRVALAQSTVLADIKAISPLCSSRCRW